MLFLILVLAAVFILSCRNTTGNAVKTLDSDAAKQSFYFEYTLDGKEMHTDAADIFSDYYHYKHISYRLNAGKQDSVMVLLTVYRDMRKFSITPSVATDPNTNALAGTVSVKDYPEKNTTLSSYNNSSPEALS